MKLDQNMLVRMGIAALLPGMRHMLEVLESHVGQYREMLMQLQNGNIEALEGLMPGLPAPKRRGRPPKALPEAATASVVEAEVVEPPDAPRRRGRPPRASSVGLTQRGVFPSGPWANMTPEERSAEMTRRQKLRYSAGGPGLRRTEPRPRKETPDQVDGFYTLFGAAKALKVSDYRMNRMVKSLSIRTQMVTNPMSAKNSYIGVLSMPQFARLQKLASTLAASDRSGAQPAPAKGHPRDRNHPGHADWLAKVTRAAKKRVAEIGPAAYAKHMSAIRNGAAQEVAQV